LYGL